LHEARFLLGRLRDVQNRNKELLRSSPARGDFARGAGVSPRSNASCTYNTASHGDSLTYQDGTPNAEE